MPKVNLPNIGLVSGFLSGDSTWTDDMNLNLVKIDALINSSVIDFRSSVPGSGTVGEAYILTTDNTVQVYYSGWRTIAPKEGMVIYNKDDSRLYLYDGTAWVDYLDLIVVDTTGDYSLRTQAGTTALPTATETLVSFDTLITERNSVQNSTLNSVYSFKATKAGIYAVKGRVSFSYTDTDPRTFDGELKLLKNGTVLAVLNKISYDGVEKHFELSGELDLLLALDDEIQLAVEGIHNFPTLPSEDLSIKGDLFNAYLVRV